MTNDYMRSVMKKKLRRFIDYTKLMLAARNPSTLYDAHEISEITIRKLKFELELNSILLEEAKNNGEKEKLDEERKELRDTLALELADGVEILSTIAANLRLDGREELARQFEILRDIRESELNDLNG
ncbi:hypothetical protein H0N98_00725 [Candidatus Micrarchaeota archaeon]|nr:hypothetical protein [Candidatus Micrarchaeota archaeon]